MLHTTQGIVLHNIKYADKKIISKIYTKDFGLISTNINVGHNPKSKIKPGVIQPLTQIELVVSKKENKDIQQVSEIKCLFIYTDIQSNFSKLCIAQFLNEVLYKCLKEQVANPHLFELICNTYQWLDSAQQDFIDTHIYFMFELSKHLGFFPTNNRDSINQYFDTSEGKFFPSIKSFPLGFDAKQSELFSNLFSYSLTLPKALNKETRNILLECLINYYMIQIPDLKEFKSNKVLQEMILEF